MAGDALDLLTRIAKETSLRYAMHLIMTGALCCKQRKGPEVEVEDIRRVYSLFSDLRRSTQYLIEYNRQYMFSACGGGGGGGERAAHSIEAQRLLSLHGAAPPPAHICLTPHPLLSRRDRRRGGRGGGCSSSACSSCWRGCSCGEACDSHGRGVSYSCRTMHKSLELLVSACSTHVLRNKKNWRPAELRRVAISSLSQCQTPSCRCRFLSEAEWMKPRLQSRSRTRGTH